MKKILISIITVMLLAMVISGVLGKVKIGSWLLPGVNQIKTASQELDTTITEISTLTSITYPQKMSDLTAASKQLIISRDDYKNKVAFSSTEDIENSRKLQNYEIEFLWTKIGNHASREGVGLKFEVVNGNTTLTKNLSFTVTGQYISITDFIYDLENDDNLNFVIENFSMLPGSDNNLVATFMVKDLYINIQSISSPAPQATEQTTDGQNAVTDTTNQNTAAMNNLVNAVNGATDTMNNMVTQ